MRIASLLLAASLASPAVAEGDDLARVCALAQGQNEAAMTYIGEAMDFVATLEATPELRDALEALEGPMMQMAGAGIEISFICTGAEAALEAAAQE